MMGQVYERRFGWDRCSLELDTKYTKYKVTGHGKCGSSIICGKDLGSLADYLLSLSQQCYIAARKVLRIVLDQGRRQLSSLLLCSDSRWILYFIFEHEHLRESSTNQSLAKRSTAKVVRNCEPMSLLLIFIYLFIYFMATLKAYGSSQARE